MSSGSIALLGAVAGFTIFLGLPLGRLSAAGPAVKALLTAVAAGILVFLLWDILAHAWAPIDEALAAHAAGTAWGDGVVLLATFGVGLLGLVHLERWTARQMKYVTMAKKTTTDGGIPITTSIATITMMANNLCADSLPLLLMTKFLFAIGSD